MFICQYCKSERKNKISFSQHERMCPLNVNRKYKNGMLGKKGSNQFIKADSLGLQKPKGVKTFGMLGKKHTEESKKLMSIKMKENHKNGKSYNRGRWKLYKENPDRSCKFYVAIMSYEEYSFIKIGITEKSFTERYTGKGYNKYEKELLCEILLNGLDALVIERQLLKKYKPNFYFDIKQIDDSFVGYTECLDIKILENLKQDIWSILGENLDSKSKILEFESPIDRH